MRCPQKPRAPMILVDAPEEALESARVNIVRVHSIDDGEPLDRTRHHGSGGTMLPFVMVRGSSPYRRLHTARKTPPSGCLLCLSHVVQE